MGSRFHRADRLCEYGVIPAEAGTHIGRCRDCAMMVRIGNGCRLPRARLPAYTQPGIVAASLPTSRRIHRHFRSASEIDPRDVVAHAAEEVEAVDSPAVDATGAGCVQSRRDRSRTRSGAGEKPAPVGPDPRTRREFPSAGGASRWILESSAVPCIHGRTVRSRSTGEHLELFVALLSRKREWRVSETPGVVHVHRHPIVMSATEPVAVPGGACDLL